MNKESDSLLKKQKEYFMLLGVTVYEGQTIEYKLKNLVNLSLISAIGYLVTLLKKIF
ncbi:hypothetical protein I8752_25220 [Nostocaceae cyanobacterium CENA369]|uniref:Uncharacterized protein n=1 Tax=Dendronalium phyllosphericum CENA369 TaxID=1725256 RepID=A0A8J7I950_9NOST|nr:hypothetical protein [Dendronalium phyllosphericum]MBH8576233.1 hypothetical protein [Dendronalium phyllosphericum CENA369]